MVKKFKIDVKTHTKNSFISFLEISFFNSFNRINKGISEYSMYKTSEEKYVD